jgi:hypothetical protein
MSFKVKNYINYIYLVVILIVLWFLYNRYEDKRAREENVGNYDAIQKYLLNDSSLADTKKPILWIPITYEYNARNWISFGSRSSFELNQPYMYLTVRSIINQCQDSFHICIIDDESFGKILPNWTVNIGSIASPVSDYMRSLALSKILYKYGGMIVPPSFLCMRDLNELYAMGTSGEKMFICETVDRNITSTTHEFYSDISFMGSPKECPVLKEMIDFMQRTISSDYTAQSEFLGDFNRWCNGRVQKHQINLIPGKLIGTKTMDDTMILVDNLLSNDYIELYPQAYGIYIPAKEILMRRHYEWFARMSQKQVLESNVIICKYILLASAPDSKKGTIEPMKNNDKWTKHWIGYWQVPSGFGLWGPKPQPFATHLIMKKTDPKP